MRQAMPVTLINSFFTIREAAVSCAATPGPLSRLAKFRWPSQVDLNQPCQHCADWESKAWKSALKILGDDRESA
jgi:hypothetical protein